jgi:TRAP-type C4-dicarboxylate transport system substrate-binding protein
MPVSTDHFHKAKLGEGLMKRTILLAATAAGMVLSATTAQAEKWDMPMAYAATNFHSEMGVVFADKVRDYTGGKIDITVHAGGSLFKGGEIKRAVQTGQAPIGERFMSAHANEAPLLGWDNLPFIATTYEENNKLWEAAQDKVNAQLDSLNLVALYTCPWPGQGFYFNKAVTSSADTKGVKFRSYNAATATFAKELGMTPVQIEAAELSQALATGVAESFISSGSTGYDRKVWEHLSHYYKVNAWLPRNYVIVNKGVWNNLDDGTRSAVQKAADETGAACAAK